MKRTLEKCVKPKMKSIYKKNRKSHYNFEVEVDDSAFPKDSEVCILGYLLTNSIAQTN